MNESASNMNIIRRHPRYKMFVPVIIGFLSGLLISIFVWQNDEVHKECTILKTSFIVQKKTKSIKQVSLVNDSHIDHEPVKPKSSHFNYDFRPYFVYSELGFHYQLVVAVLTTEKQLLTYGVAINNTWIQGLSKLVFFTPYSKSANFHERFNNVLNLNVVQLPDIMDDSSDIEFYFRVLQYLRDHYLNTYNWFMVVQEKSYVNTENVLKFIKSLNSSNDLFIGHPIPYIQNDEEPMFKKNGQVFTTYCSMKAGFILSHSLLSKLEHLSVSNFKTKDIDSVTLGKSIFLSSQSQCINKDELKELFKVSNGVNAAFTLSHLKNKAKLHESLVLYPIENAKSILEIHQHILIPMLQSTYDDIHDLQDKIQKLQALLPDEVPEKTLHWPIGFTPPFKPSSRFEVIQWTYFDRHTLYGYSDTEPTSTFNEANKKDINDIMNTVKQAIQRETGEVKYDYKLQAGYRRLDPQRGSEYIIDLIKTSANKDEEDTLKRVLLLRPFTKLEALPMPAATEQKGIHLVLPVLREEIGMYEKFLQMYKRVCLQTGENVVLLTVFINIRIGQFEGEEKDDPFMEAKNLIGRYKHSYMWAQLPWLQVGVKKYSQVLLMDIVSMKLPANALIFLASLTTHFTTNFMNRCRVNVVSGTQVFFPIPFAEYDPKLVYKSQQKPTFVEVHRNNGYWDDSDHTVACFNNKDFKDIRMLREDFLDENQHPTRTLLDIFNNSKFQVFRAVDAELRKLFTPQECKSNMNVTSYTACTEEAGKRLGSRSQLAQILFQNERFASTKS